jgi:sigma-B regulation protein RsbU (phosphoserine phosphatase)
MAIEISPTVILQDLIMPEIDGLHLVKRFKTEPATKEIPLIVLSSEENAKVKAVAFSLNANDYIIKLPDQLELIARIRYHSQGYINMLERNEAFETMRKTQAALAAELAEAADYVLSLLPSPMDNEIKINWKFIPSTSLGGDAFGYHWLDADNFAIYLLDVAGHGVGAALLSVSAIEVLRAQTLPDTDFHNPAIVLTQLNKSFKMIEHNQKFFTIWYGVFNKKRRDLLYSSAGHPPAILLNGVDSGHLEIVQLKTPGTMIGAIEDAEYVNETVQVKDFNKLFVYSDGTFEIFMPDGKMLDFSEFIKIITTPENNKLPNLENIYGRISGINSAGLFEDDFSMLEISFENAEY